MHVLQEGDYLIEGDLRRERSLNLKRLQAIKSYRGMRHSRAFRFAASAPPPTPVHARAKENRGCKE